MRIKYGKYNVMPFTSKAKATKFAARARKKGYKPMLGRKNNCYLVMSKNKR